MNNYYYSSNILYQVKEYLFIIFIGISHGTGSKFVVILGEVARFPQYYFRLYLIIHQDFIFNKLKPQPLSSPENCSLHITVFDILKIALHLPSSEFPSHEFVVWVDD